MARTGSPFMAEQLVSEVVRVERIRFTNTAATTLRLALNAISDLTIEV